jgi:hypothetical protein
VRKAQLEVDPLLPEPLQFHKILDDGRPMAGVDDLVSLAEHKDLKGTETSDRQCNQRVRRI